TGPRSRRTSPSSAPASRRTSAGHTQGPAGRVGDSRAFHSDKAGSLWAFSLPSDTSYSFSSLHLHRGATTPARLSDRSSFTEDGRHRRPDVRHQSVRPLLLKARHALHQKFGSEPLAHVFVPGHGEHPHMLGHGVSASLTQRLARPPDYPASSLLPLLSRLPG